MSFSLFSLFRLPFPCSPQCFENSVLPQADGFQGVVVLLTSLSGIRRP